MKYYLFESTFKENHPTGPAFKAALDAHHEFLQPFCDNGQLLISGPKTAGGGGVMLLKFESEEERKEFCEKDPFVTSGVQEYHVVEFNVFNVQDYAKEWV